MSDVTRRMALALLGAGAAGGVAFGLDRAGILKFLKRDEEKCAAGENDFHVLRRPFVADPTRELSVLGYGGTRLPILNQQEKDIDYELAGSLYEFAIRHGVNVFDTGYFYHRGESEKFIGSVLSKHPRESYYLSDKLPLWQMKTLDDAKRIFNEQLKRLRTDRFDAYMIHSMGDERRFREVWDKIGLREFFYERKQAGQIKHFGFSFHGRSDFLRRLLDEEPQWECIVILLNALEHRTNPDSLKSLELLYERKKAVFAMEPLGGGRVINLSAAAKAKLANADPGSTPAKWGFRYALSSGPAQSLMCGMGKLKWLAENVRTLSVEEYRPLSDEEQKLYGSVMDEFAKRKTIPCTGCRYCDPCPYKVAIPEIFKWYNSFASAGRLPAREGENDSQALRREFLSSYSRSVPPGRGPERCINCRRCTIACPQFIFKVPEALAEVAKFLAAVREDFAQRGS